MPKDDDNPLARAAKQKRQARSDQARPDADAARREAEREAQGGDVHRAGREATGDLKRLQAKLPAELHARFKARAEAEGRTMTATLEALVRAYLRGDANPWGT